MIRLTLFSIPLVLTACASEPLTRPPVNELVADYVTTAQLDEVNLIRKGNSDSWQYLNDRYVIYRGRNDFLVEFRVDCADLTDNSWIPADYIHDHRNLRAGEDTIRGCIVDRIYPISNDQRIELRNLNEAPGRGI
jgi:hypothetical protein